MWRTPYGSLMVLMDGTAYWSFNRIIFRNPFCNFLRFLCVIVQYKTGMVPGIIFLCLTK